MDIEIISKMVSFAMILRSNTLLGLVHQGAAKLPALKFFVASKLENLSTTKNAFFVCKKCLRAGSFAASLCKRMTATCLGTSKLTLIDVRSSICLPHV